MAFVVGQAGTSLYKIDPSTGAATALSLPAGVVLATDRKPRFAVLNQFVVMVNTPSRNLAIDPEGVVRVLVPKAPVSPPKTAQGSGTGLTGAYLYRVSFIVNDTIGNLLMESPLSPPSISLTVSNKDILGTLLPISTDTVSARRIYRTTANGSAYYHLFDVDGNTNPAFHDTLADASLSLLPTLPTTLTPPPGTLESSRLRNIVAWKNRLWACGDDPTNVDTCFFTEDGIVYQWPNSLTAYPTGYDSEGIVAFAPRRDQLGLLKRSGVWQITGTSTANFSVIQIDTQIGRGGCVAVDSVCIVNDTAYWLGKDGIYQWDSNGVRCISDEKVGPWFKSDTYFNRARFPFCFSKYNPVTTCIEFHLAAAGSSVEDRWVSYNVTTGAWFGPHKTALFTPNCGLLGETSDGLPVVLVGGTDGLVYTENNVLARDGAATVIDMDVFTPFFSGDAPDIEHTWLELSVLSRIEAAGTLTFTPYVGGLGAAAGTDFTHDQTLGRQLLGRPGDGALLRFRIRKNTVSQHAVVYGFEVPYFETGRR